MNEFNSTDFRRSVQSTRERIIVTVTRHFARKSLRSVPLKETAGDAGVSTPLIIEYFSSKESPLAKLIGFSQLKSTFGRAPLNELGQWVVSATLAGQRVTEQSMIPLIAGSLDSEETAKVAAERFSEAAADDPIRRAEEDGPEDVGHNAAVHRGQIAISLYVEYLVLSDIGLIDEMNAPRILVEALDSCLQQVIEHG